MSLYRSVIGSHERIPALVVSATHSGAGKTTVAGSIIRGLRDSGLAVQPFKLGPDFIDAAYLAEAAGRAAVNLDLWMMGAEGVVDSFRRWSDGADIAVIEAMGALHDGVDGSSGGSAAEIAKLLGVPVVVVLDVWGMTRTTGAVMLGMGQFDRAVKITGYVLNRIGGDAHLKMIERSLPGRLRRMILGAIPREDSLLIPERHLGLLTTAENESECKEREAARRRAAGALDLARLATLAKAGVLRGSRAPVPRAAGRALARLAVARDAAFCFYYEDNLRLLGEAGFELLAFSPIRDRKLPPGTDAVLLGGGYPESFAGELAANTELAAELRGRVQAGMPVWAECGGLIYLGRSLTCFDGRRHRMSDVLPLETVMDRNHLAISYVEARTRLDSPLGGAGTVARGQEFHQSRIVAGGSGPNLFELTTSAGEARRGGFLAGSVAASYVHLHLASCPALAPSLLASALRARDPASSQRTAK
jgi:cobyrinic acid a,c-diamide synthase